MKAKQPTIVVFFGGQAATHDLSQETGYWMCNYIPRSQYRVVPVRVTPEGQWQVPLGGLPKAGPVDRMLHMLFSNVRALPVTKALERLLHHPVSALMTTLRGIGGDDGSLQSLGSALNIPVVGSSSATCQQTTHKHLCATRVDDIVGTPYALTFRATKSIDDIVAQTREVLTGPLFVKPDGEEGSAGVTQVDDVMQLPAAVAAARRWGDILIQERAPGDEITVSILEDEHGNLTVLPPTVIVPKKATFYDQLAKRRGGRVILHTPTATGNPILEEAQTIARDVFEHLGCKGYAAIDLVARDGEIKLLEVNTVPTLTGVTPFKQQLAAAHLHPSAMVTSLLRRTLSEES